MKKYLRTPEEIIDALQAGKTLHNKYSQWVLYNGFIMRKDKNSDNWSVNDSLCSRFDKDAYIYEDPKPLKLEVGKFYRTMNGSKVVVAYINTDFPDKYPVCVVIIGNTKMYWVGIDGSRGTDISRASDLVAPWEEH